MRKSDEIPVAVTAYGAMGVREASMKKFKFSKCNACGRRFRWSPRPSRPTRESCSPRCHMQHLANRKRKIPLDKALLTEMYVTRRMTIKAISEHFGNPGAPGVYRALAKLKIWRPEIKQQNNPPRDHSKVVSLYKTGLTVAEVAAKFPCSEGYIYSVLKSSGVKPKRRTVTECQTEGCGAPVWKFKAHGYLVGNRCRKHHVEYKAALRRNWYRRVRGMKLDNSVCVEELCNKQRWINEGRHHTRCRLHYQLRIASKSRDRYRLKNNVAPERWRVVDA